VDASLDSRVYLRFAEARGWVIRHVLDTHVHADHLSRSRSLAELAGASLWLPEQQRVRFPHRALRDGDELRFGSSMLRALRTPGHTPESTSSLVDERWLLTGDTLFPAAVGRPDLEANAEQARSRALMLHASLRRLFGLDPRVLVLSCHASAPVCFDQRVVGEALGVVREAIRLPEAAAEFAEHILARIPPAPPNHHTIVGCNEAGELPPGDPTDLEAGANRCAIASRSTGCPSVAPCPHISRPSRFSTLSRERRNASTGKRSIAGMPAASEIRLGSAESRTRSRMIESLDRSAAAATFPRQANGAPEESGAADTKVPRPTCPRTRPRVSSSR